MREDGRRLMDDGRWKRKDVVSSMLL